MCPGLAVAWCECGACLGKAREACLLIWAHWEMWLGIPSCPHSVPPRKHGFVNPKGPVLTHFLVPRHRPKLSSQTEGRSGVVGETQITGLPPFIFLCRWAKGQRTDNTRTRNPWKRRRRVGLRFVKISQVGRSDSIILSICCWVKRIIELNSL